MIWVPIAGGSGFGGAAFQNGTRLDSVATGGGQPAGLITDWTCGQDSQSRGSGLLCFQGGHDDGVPSCIVELGLQAAIPSWNMLWVNTSGGSSVPSYNCYPSQGGANTDGSPGAGHGYYGGAFVDGCDRVWCVFSDPGGLWTTQVHSCSLTSISAGVMVGGFTYHGLANPSISGEPSNWTWEDLATAYDYERDVLHMAPGYGAFQFSGSNPGNAHISIDCAAARLYGPQVSTSANGVPGGTVWGATLAGSPQTGWSSILNEADIGIGTSWWVMGSINNSELFIMDVVNAPTVYNSVATTGTGRWIFGDGGVYHPGSKSFLVHGVASSLISGTGATIYKLTRTTGNPLTATWTWGTLTNGSGSATPTTDQTTQFNGTYGKLRLLKNFALDSNGTWWDCLLTMCSWAGPEYVYKLRSDGTGI